jgi:hypothetical protein
MYLTPAYQTKSAVLFIIFNRHDTALRVLAEIKKARPARLYITADAPRLNRPGEDIACAKTKEAVMDTIDWECEVKTLFREQNAGPKEAISSAISWFFETENEGIILEHDCLPNNSFFNFCDTLLTEYRSDNRIWLVSGSNLARKKFGNASYYFSRLTNGWGFATWKRSWSYYNKDLTQYEEGEVRHYLENIFDDPIVIDTWEQIFKDMKAGKIDTWDYQATFAHLFNNCLNIMPNNNLVSNIGFGEKAENTKDENSFFASIPLEPLNEITHPKYILAEKEADDIILNEEFKIDERRRKLNSPKYKVKRWFKSLNH